MSLPLDVHVPAALRSLLDCGDASLLLGQCSLARERGGDLEELAHRSQAARDIVVLVLHQGDAVLGTQSHLREGLRQDLGSSDTDVVPYGVVSPHCVRPLALLADPAVGLARHGGADHQGLLATQHGRTLTRIDALGGPRPVPAQYAWIVGLHHDAVLGSAVRVGHDLARHHGR